MEEQKPLVSIITPCLNGETYVHRFLESILYQTYKHIELIFVNDGSTDKTEEIVLSYKIKFEEKGIKLIYLYQDNKGLGGAINSGLLKVSGKYFCWPDSDDYLESESIAKRVSILEANPDYAVVSSDAYIRSIDSIESPIGLLSDNYKERFKPNQFKLLIDEKSQFCPGTHMMRTDCFKETHKNMSIFPAKRGQNWQILLPVYYRYKRYYIDSPLYNYIIYKTSMSQGDITKEKKLFRSKEHEEIIINTIQSMEIPTLEKKNILSHVRKRYVRKNNRIAFEFNDRLLFYESYDYLKSIKSITFKDLIIRILFKNKVLYEHILKSKLKSKLLN